MGCGLWPNLGDSMKTMMTPNGWAGGSRLRALNLETRARLGLSLKNGAPTGP